ncbi:hypothetical protein [Burkholderia vietnamiensis]|uniref:hypothetical protein n=1 Tax=Burkholderia vietnamiensis TaxID=60552 RepID=UPI000F810A41|nr:hypothetical protein [Burkholderia vietnamiensis]HDR9036307.1 hypothetical protein [Burkholderia vietnamiensis]
MRSTYRRSSRALRRSLCPAAGSADGSDRMMLSDLTRRFPVPRCSTRTVAAFVWLAAALPVSVLVPQPAFGASDVPASAAPGSSSASSPARHAAAAHPASSAAPSSAAAAHHAHSASGASAASAASAASDTAETSASEAEAPAPAPTPPRRHPPLSAEQAKEATARALDMRERFAQEVTRRLNVPANDQRAYADRLQRALTDANLGDLAGEYVAMVDRAPNVQALFIYFRATPDNAWLLIGASPVGTGWPGQYDHFLTPLGVFHHSPDNMDFRAEGTMNDHGIRGYGAHDMRIYDFGWVEGERGWGKGGKSPMRFQMHATDPDRLEPLLGIRHSKGCVRIPASLNTFLDRHAILDDDYQARVESGRSLWVLRHDRDITPIAGRYLVVIDSERSTRPAWSPAPGHKARSKLPKNGDTAD